LYGFGVLYFVKFNTPLSTALIVKNISEFLLFLAVTSIESLLLDSVFLGAFIVKFISLDGSAIDICASPTAREAPSLWL